MVQCRIHQTVHGLIPWESEVTLEICGTAAGVEDTSKMLVASLNHNADVPWTPSAIPYPTTEINLCL